jgi:putative permease
MNKTLSTWVKRYLSRPEAIVLLVIFVMTVVVFKTMGQVLAPVIISVIIAYLLSGMVKKLQQWHIPHLLAVSLVFLFFIGLFLISFLYLLPLLWNEMAGLVSEIPAAFNRSQELLFNLQNRFPDFISTGQIHQIMMYASSYLANFGKAAVTFSLASLFGVMTLIVYLILVPLLVFFFLRDGKVIMQWFINFLPKKKNILEKLWSDSYEKVTCYIQGKVIEVILIALITIIAFWILGLKYAVLLGALVGLSVVVPYFGIAVVTIPIVAVGLMQWGGSNHFLYLMLVYIAISILDANVLVPFLFAEVMDLHPLVIILAVLFFGSLFGFWGVFFAIPMTALINVVINAWPKES